MTQKISVCIPVYNPSPTFLKAAVDSALQQQGEGFNIEIVISDDSSVIDYTNLINDFPKDIVRFHRNPKNLGMVANWNLAVSRGNGDLVLVLGHDDILWPGMFDAYVQTFRQHPEIVLCSCGRKFIDQRGEIITPKRAVNDRQNIYLSKEKYILTAKEVSALCLRNGNPIGEPSCVMFHRWAFEKVGGFDPTFKHAADVAFHMQMSRLGSVGYLKKPFLLRRLHANNFTFSNLSQGNVTMDRVRLYECFSDQRVHSRKEIRSFRAYLLAASLYDACRAFKTRNWYWLRLSLATACGFLEFAPFTYIHYIREIFTCKNVDAM